MPLIFVMQEMEKLLIQYQIEQPIIQINIFLTILKKQGKELILQLQIYIALIKKWFPKAKIIIDLFHIVQLLTKSLNKTRINVMNENKEDRTKFKRYFKLVLKSKFELDTSSWKKFKCFKSSMTEVDVVGYLLSKDKFFENSYDLYQDILYHLQHLNYIVINQEYKDISKIFKTK